jgi:hypothetical protein
VVEQAMAELARESAAGHQRQQAAAQEQQQALSEQWRGTAQQVADTWTQALQTQQGTQQQLVQALDAALQRFATQFEARSADMLAGWEAHAVQSQATQAQSDQARLAAWNESLQSTARSLAAEWQQVGAQSAQDQQRVAALLQAAADHMAQQVATQVQATVEGASTLVAQSADLVRARSESEARWMESHQAQTQALAQVWQQSLAELRGDEQQRGQAAVERLDALQAAVAQHLAILGAALEAPLTRLLQTASEVPRAAAEVIAQLRQEMTRLGERDNAALAERTAMWNSGHPAGQVRCAVQQRRPLMPGRLCRRVLEQAGDNLRALGAQAARWTKWPRGRQRGGAVWPGRLLAMAWAVQCQQRKLVEAPTSRRDQPVHEPQRRTTGLLRGTGPQVIDRA